MTMNGTFRFLMPATAVLLWVGAIAVANESDTGEEVPLPVASAPASEEETPAVDEVSIEEAANEGGILGEQPAAYLEE